MMEVELDQNQVRRLQAALAFASKRLPIELKIAVNKTATAAKSQMSKEIREELAATAKDVGKTIKVIAKASNTKLSATVRLKETYRLPIKAFKPRQIKKGTSYRVSKSKGRTLAPGAFMGPAPDRMLVRWKGNVFKRRGKSRLKIDKLHGASPWGAYVKRHLDEPVVGFTNERLSYEVERRIRTVVLKRAGLI